MRLLTDLVERARALVFRGRIEADMAEEIRFHIERETAERIRRGATPEEARRHAVREFGGVERYKEETRDARGVRPLEDLAADVRYAVRSLRRNPGFAAAAILVLGLAIGAATAAFSVVDSVVLADLPYPDAGRLVRVYQKNSPTNLWALSTVDVQAIQERQHVFADFGAVQATEAALSGGAGPPERIRVGRATSGFFDALAIHAATGRLLRTGDESAEAPATVVVSHALAERLLGGVDVAVGRSITLDDVSHTVVGVLPAGVDGLAGVTAEAWPVLRLQAPARRGPFWLHGLGRLKAGIPLESAARDLGQVSRTIFPAWASSFADSSARLTPVPLRDAVVGRAGVQVGLFAGAVALVLLIAVANVASLFLVRASAREQELSVRVALGGSRFRVARLLLTESLVLTALAGVAGLLVALGGVRLAPSLGADLPRIGGAALNGRALGFGVLLTLVSGLLVGISPVMVALARGRLAFLRTDTRRVTGGRRSNAVRGAFVVAEFALSLPLLLGAGLLLQSFLNLQRVDPGFDPAGVVAARISLPQARYPGSDEVRAFWRTLEQRTSGLPDVSGAGLGGAMPPDNPGTINNFNLIDRPVPAGTAEPVAPWAAVTNGYFRTLGIALQDGRLFTPADSATADPVVVVSRSWADRYYPGESPVGRQMIEGGCTTCPPTSVIGVVGDVKYLGLAGSGDAVYMPLAQAGPRTLNLLVRSRVTPAGTFRSLRQAVASIDPELPVVESVMRDRLASSLDGIFRVAAVLTAFAVAAAGLAALGIFGLMSYVVRQRRREIGVRIALGAEPGAIIWMVVKRGIRLAMLGAGIGLGLALLETRWLGDMLFGTGQTVPLALAGVLTLLLLAGVAACWIPAQRAARIHPVEAIGAD